MKRLAQILFFSVIFVLSLSAPALAEKAKPAHAGEHAADPHPPAAQAAAAAPAEPAEKAEKAEKADDAAHEAPKGPQRMRVGMRLTKLNKFEMGPGSYSAELYLTFKCDHEPCKPDFDVANGKVASKE